PQHATNLVGQKYFRGPLGAPERERSLRQVADRVVDTITAWGAKDGYFVDRAEAETFNAELKHLIVNQRAAFNSPVWFNLAVKGEPQQCAACLIVDHPDVEDFIWCKAVEERKARVLRDSGFDMDLDGKDSHSTQYQNANNSVRVTDEFMQAVLDNADWHLRAVTTGEVLETMKARELFGQIADAAWQCADPGMQFDTTINRWHTAANTGRINASNPCSEYMHLDNSACNLASLNLLKFLNDDDTFDVEGFRAAVEVVVTAQEKLGDNDGYQTEKVPA